MKLNQHSPKDGGNDEAIPNLGAFEQLVMLSLTDAHPRSYGITIQLAAERRARHSVSLGAVYTTLDRLERKGLVASWRGDPTPERGGRSKRFFELTPQGNRSLEVSLARLGMSVTAGARA